MDVPILDMRVGFLGVLFANIHQAVHLAECVHFCIYSTFWLKKGSIQVGPESNDKCPYKKEPEI